MSFGSNLQFMRKMRNSMTQEELTEKMGVSRQTVSKWEMDGAYPAMEKAEEDAICHIQKTEEQRGISNPEILSCSLLQNMRQLQSVILFRIPPM